MKKLKYILDFKYDNKAKVTEFLVIAYASAANLSVPTPREMGVLRDYILNGYNDTTKKNIVKFEKINMDNLHVVNSKLEKKGYLVKHPTNLTNRMLSKDLESISILVRDLGKDGELPCALIQFNKSK